ncbi:bifunctional 4-hydroxy-2-oxoglutarate aldolase/2-dehydro-3-deoxy-phosphogluconate aldolase [Kocuria kalidii]|uniref:bifunctional 4-hydroxy-2-oxoglutarate aldolase/2-dehydro-3-deoxy-phosphogluconate aldolase n=1 Tax=Kocuria kalidii TaxID=3376283 RepID=UPI0037A28D01
MASVDDFFDCTFAHTSVMAILRGYPPERTVELATRAWELGIHCVEVPVQSPAAVEALAATVAAGRDHGRTVGAGTVVSLERLEQAVTAGAGFTVAPGLDLTVAGASREAGLAHLPGVATASEIQRAAEHGMRWVKAFPANSLGTAWFRGMRGPFPEIRIVATGGITARNASEYLGAGADVVAVGSALEDPAQLELLAELMPAAPTTAP